jgi:1,4-dihydroxy-2-naphthoate octaprenyltransferase
MAVPIGLSIFNVILLNEFPDYPADAVAGKRNLAVRLGRQRACIIYALAGVGGWIGMALSVRYGVPRQALYFCAPVLVLSVVLIILVLRGRWREREVLERLCGANLLVNLGTTASYMAAFLV